MTHPSTDTAGRQDRFGKLIERADGADVPFYDGQPVQVAGWKWLVMVLAAAAGFLALALIPATGNLQLLGTRILFVAIPAVAFIALTGGAWKAIFRPLKGKDVPTILIFWAIYMVLSSVVTLVIQNADPGHTTANRATDSVTSASEVIFFYLGTFIQLFGEELFSIIPFLAIAAVAYQRFKLSRKTSLIIAWLLTAVWFGAAHLPTYDWNFLQCFLVIGLARLVLTLAYLRTKNILVSFGAHLMIDWGIFTASLIFA